MIVTWVKLDDAFLDHPKIAGLSAEAFRLHVRGLLYSARFLTDGRIPGDVVERWMTEIRRRTRHGPAWVYGGTGAEPGQLRELTDARVWERFRAGYRIHGFLEYNPSRAEVAARRAADLERKRRARDAVRAESDRNPDGVRLDSAATRPGPARPLPVTPNGVEVVDIEDGGFSGLGENPPTDVEEPEPPIDPDVPLDIVDPLARDLGPLADVLSNDAAFRLRSLAKVDPAWARIPVGSMVGLRRDVGDDDLVEALTRLIESPPSTAVRSPIAVIRAVVDEVRADRRNGQGDA